MIKNFFAGLLFALLFIGCTYQAGIAMDKEWEMRQERTQEFLNETK